MSGDGRVRADLIREARRRRGWSQTALGERVNVSRETVRRWEAGKDVAPANIGPLADALGVSVDVILLRGSDTSDSERVQSHETQTPGAQGVDVLVFEQMPKGSIEDILAAQVPTWPHAQSLVRHDRVIQVRVSDESLEPRYRPGDYVLIDLTATAPYQRELVWCEVGGERLFLRYERREDGSEVVTPHNRGCGPTHPFSSARVLGAIIAGVHVERRRRAS